MAIIDNDWIAWRDQMRTELPQAFDDVTASRVARDFRETIAHKAFLAGKSAGRRHPQPVTPAVDGESFICYLIDNCEREVIHEESLHEWLADFLKNPRYHKPVTPVEFTESCGCVFCDLECPHSEEDCKLIALLEDVAVQHEGLENYGDSCGPRMCIRACRGAIAALKAAHAQPVTPAGGEVEPVAWLHKDGYTMMLDKESHRFTHPEYWTALYTHPPVADAALERVKALAAEWEKSPGREFFAPTAAEELCAALN